MYGKEEFIERLHTTTPYWSGWNGSQIPMH